MPNFFDKKEEVINLELTQYGKYLLSKGKLQPEYYAFYDDDILYDTAYTGYTEQQNESQVRILENTPSMKAQYVRHQIERDVTKSIEVIRKEGSKPDCMQQIIEKIYSTSLPIGTSDYSTIYAPSWSIRLLDGQISSSFAYFTGSYGTSPIPQINIKSPEYRIKITEGDPSVTPDAQCEILGPGESENPIQPYFNIINDVNIVSKEFIDGVYFRIEQDNIVLQIDEINSLFTNDNFDIEVFRIEDVINTEDTSNVEKRLIPLQFIKKPENIVNDILIDLPESEEPEITPSNVEHYLDILVDKELPDEYWASLGASPRSGEVFYNEEDFENKKPEKPDLAVKGLYDGNNTGPFGEDCG